MFSKNGLEYKCCKDFDVGILMQRSLLDILCTNKMMIKMYLKERRFKMAVRFKWLRIGISGGFF